MITPWVMEELTSQVLTLGGLIEVLDHRRGQDPDMLMGRIR